MTPDPDPGSSLGPGCELETIGRADSAVGEVVLRRRGEVVELIVGGVFAMDTVDVSSEVELATIALASHPRPRRVLVGGLGLGFTASRVLADERVESLVVAEIAGPLIDWAHAGLLPAGGLGDHRVTLLQVDVADLLRHRAAQWDLVLLDVDNGPGFLVRPGNIDLYAGPGLRSAAESLGPDGVLAIWSSHRAPALLEELESLGMGSVAEVAREVRRDGRELQYAIYLLTRGAAR